MPNHYELKSFNTNFIFKSHHDFIWKFSSIVLSTDSFSSALLVVSSKEEGGREEGEGELFDKFFVAFVFQLNTAG